MIRIYSHRNWLFILHRLTGAALLVYLVAHILAISTAAIMGPATFTRVMQAFATPALMGVEFVIVLCVAFHALNGLHLIASERGWLRRRNLAVATRPVAVIVLVVTVAAVATAFAR